MSSKGGSVVYYCSHCQVEIPLARVCPRCHRKGTLVPREQGGSEGGSRLLSTRRAASSTPTPSSTPLASGPSRRRVGARSPSLRIGLGATAVVILVGLGGVGLYLGLGRGGAPRDPSGAQGQAAPSPRPVAVLPDAGRHFGASRPGQASPPAEAPRRCGEQVALRTEVLFAQTPEPSSHRAVPLAPRAGGTPAPPAQAAAPPQPEASVTHHRFLLSGAAPSLEWVLLEVAQSFRMGGKEVPLLRLGPQGALLLDRKQSKLVRRGPGEPFAPGLRSSNLVGQPLAVLGRDAGGGLTVARMLRSEPLVRSLVQDPLALLAWLTPAPPSPQARSFIDARPLPRGLVPGLAEVRRTLRPDPKAKVQAGGPRRYLVEGSAQVAAQEGEKPGTTGGGKPGASSRLRLEGEVELAPGGLVPRHARLRVSGSFPGRPPVRELLLELKSLGQGCNR